MADALPNVTPYAPAADIARDADDAPLIAPAAPGVVDRVAGWFLPGLGAAGHAFTPAEVGGLMDGVYARGDAVVGRTLLVHAALAFGLAAFYGTWLITTLCTVCALGMFFSTALLAPRTFLTRCVAGVALQTFVALHIYQLHGLAEMHFFFFTAFTVMIVYQDWRCMWPGAVLIIGQHILFAVLTNSGVNLYFFESRHIAFTKLFFHFGIAIVDVALCGYWAHLERQHTLSSAWQQRGLERQRGTIARELDRSQRSEQAVRTTSHLLGTLVENVPGGILVEDARRRVRHANRSVCDLFGWDPNRAEPDAESAPLFAHLASLAADPEQFRTRIGAVLGRPSVIGGVEIALADGRTIEWDHVPLSLDGESRGHLWHFRDVTDRKQAETERMRLEGQLQQSQKLQAIGTLAGGIAHDFNNILASIMGYSEIAHRDAAGLPPVQESLDQVLIASRRAADLVTQILAFSRQRDTRREALDLNALTDESVRLLRASLPPSVALAVDAPGDPLWVEADASQLHQVLINLCSNAAHAQDQRGPIEIRLERRAIGTAEAARRGGVEPGDYAELTVRDRGCGMDEATAHRVFEPFFTTKPPGQGTGLGLSVVHGIVRAHRGTIDFDTAPQRGTTMRVLLPSAAAVPASTALETPAHAAEGSGRGERVLLVDDEAGVALTRQALLEGAGFVVEIQTHPRAALEAFAEEPARYAVVLTDHMMPGMNGFELAEALHAIRADLPIVLTTGNTAAFEDDELQRRRVQGLIPKPSSVAELVDGLRRALDAVS